MKEKYRVGVITISDKGALGIRKDESGPLIEEMLMAEGKYRVEKILIIPDDEKLISETLTEMSDTDGMELILTTGGTGFADRDNTPEATLAVATKNAPGIAEYMRAKSFEITPKAVLSRGVSVIRNHTLIINLPGSPKAVRENLGFILPALDHGLGILLGRDGECGQK